MGQSIEKRLIATALAALLALAISHAKAQDSFVLDTKPPTSSLKFGGALQFRYAVSVVRESQSVRNDTTLGFDFRRLRFRVRGDTAGGRVRYFVQAEANNGDWRLFDMWAEADLAEGLTLRAGQFIVPFQRENIVDPYRQLAQERSIVAFQINPIAALRSQGVQLRYTAVESRATLALTDGSSDLNRPFTSPTDGEAVTLRLETALKGTLKQFAQYSSLPGTDEGLLLGGAIHTERRAEGGDRFAWTGDLSYQADGFNAGLSLAGHIAEDLTLRADPLPEHAFGVVGQAGLFVTDDVEVFARYEWATTSDDNHPNLDILTAGMNWYIAGQALRFSFNASYVFDELGPLFTRPIDGFIDDFQGQDGELVFRAQLQLLF